MSRIKRRKVLITGAVGGMGRACVRLLGATHDLVLSDIAAPALDKLVQELEGEGYVVSGAHAGDLCDDQVLASLAGELTGEAFIVIHTAGLSPSLAGWREIMRVNLIGTEKLLAALEPLLQSGSVAVLIASAAGHSMPAIPEVDALLAEPLNPEFLERAGEVIHSMASGGAPAGEEGISYSLSKRAILTLCERKASEWGQRGARIVTISPGLILTPMGRKELAQTPGAAELLDATPAGRSGTAMDIALAARFLASDEASFITGSDLKVDGGGIAATRLLSRSSE